MEPLTNIKPNNGRCLNIAKKVSLPTLFYDKLNVISIIKNCKFSITYFFPNDQIFYIIYARRFKQKSYAWINS